MSSKRHSMAYISVDGQLLPTLPGAKIDLGGRERAAVTGDNAILGYSEKIKPAMLECEVSLGEGMSLAQWARVTQSTITYEADTGQTYMIRDAFLTEPPSLASGDGGKVSLKFSGHPAQEMGV